MKKTGFFLAALCALLLAAGCSAARPASAAASAQSDGREPIPFSDSQLYAAALVGYDDLTELPFYLTRYVGADSVPTHYFSNGEYYLVIPRYEGMKLELYRNEMETGASTLVFEDSDCHPFLIQCNVSDIFSDVTISFAYQGEKIQFSPSVSLKDGSVQVGERGLNLTK